MPKRCSILLAVFAGCLLPVLLLAQPDTTWTRVYGNDSLADMAQSVRQTSDGGYIVVGTSYAFGSGSLFWAVKLDPGGDTVWTRAYGGPGLDGANDVRQTADGGYIIVGALKSSTDYDVFLVRTDSVGDTVWTRTYGGIRDDIAFSAHQTPDGGWIVGGHTRSLGAGRADLWLLRVDSAGDTVWTRTYGGSEDDYGRFAMPTPDGGYIFVGETQSFGAGQSDVYIVKTGVTGDTVWTRSYGATGAEGAYEAVMPSDSEYAVVGHACEGIAGDPDYWLLKLDADGDTLWTRTYGGEMNDWCRSVVLAEDGGYMMAGESASFGSAMADFWMVKADPDGLMLWWRTVGGDHNDGGMRVAPTFDAGYVVAGHTRSFGAGSYDFYVVKLAPDLGVEERDVVPVATRRMTLSSGELWLAEGEPAALLGIAGRRVMTLQPGENDIRSVSPGIYFVHQPTADSRQRTAVRKVVIQR